MLRFILTLRAANCSVISRRGTALTLTTEVDPSTGKWTARVLHAYNGKRQELLQASGAPSYVEALEQLHRCSSQAAHNFTQTAGVDYPKRIRIREDRCDSDDNGALDDSEEDGENGEASLLVSVSSQPRQRQLEKIAVRLSSPGRAGAQTAIVPPPHPSSTPTPNLHDEPHSLQPSSPKKTTLMVALAISFSGNTLNILTRVEPSVSGIRAKAIEMVRSSYCKDDAEQPELQALIERLRLWGDEYDVRDMEDLTDLLMVSEVPRIYVTVTSV